MRAWLYAPLVGALACGRVGFSASDDGQLQGDARVAKDGHGVIADAAYFDLGSATGTNIVTVDGNNDHGKFGLSIHAGMLGSTSQAPSS